MLFAVDFAVKFNRLFQTVHKAFIFAESVSECQDKAENMLSELSQFKNQHIHIFIDEGEND